MTDQSISPAPLVEHALESLRGNAPEATPAPEPAPAPAPAPARPSRAQLNRERHQAEFDAARAQDEIDTVVDIEPGPAESVTSASLGSALEALRTISASAQTRLADPNNFEELPRERGLLNLGPYVEHVMREAQAAAAAYREESARETTVQAAKVLSGSAASAETIRREADAYRERTVAEADALLAERLHRVAELTGRLSQMAQLAGDEFAEDRRIRDQMMRFISDLTAAAEEAVADVFPSTAHDAPS